MEKRIERGAEREYHEALRRALSNHNAWRYGLNERPRNDDAEAHLFWIAAWLVASAALVALGLWLASSDSGPLDAVSVASKLAGSVSMTVAFCALMMAGSHFSNLVFPDFDHYERPWSVAAFCSAVIASVAYAVAYASETEMVWIVAVFSAMSAAGVWFFSMVYVLCALSRRR